MKKEFTVIEHLEELRRRVIVSLVAVGITTAISIPFSSFIIKLLKVPAAGAIEKLAFFSPEEAFLIYMRVSFLAGLILALPVIAYEIWAFLSPALGEKIKDRAVEFIAFLTTLFLAGIAFAYFILLPAALKFLLNIGGEDLEPVISAARYISFVTALIFACGLIFEIPALSFFLTRAGIINAGLMRKYFKYALMVIAVLAAIITPTGDAFNMLMLALPMVGLYEASIWISLFAGKRRP